MSGVNVALGGGGWTNDYKASCISEIFMKSSERVRPGKCQTKLQTHTPSANTGRAINSRAHRQ